MSILSLPEEERDAFINKTCKGDPTLQEEIESLLSHENGAQLFFDDLGSLIDGFAKKKSEARNEDGENMHRLIGTTVHQYAILGQLGRGGMGVVYKAHDTKLDRTVALKFLSEKHSLDQGASDRFLIEARAAARLQHPNICTIHEIATSSDGHMFIAMAFYEGATLKQRIESSTLTILESINFAIHVAAGLVEAHSHGIVHRDVKPANVMVTTSGQIKLLDFGLAIVANADRSKSLGTMGTVAYMSPEQALGDPVDARTDIWSLGVLLYEMLTGQRPFAGQGIPEVIQSILDFDPTPVSSLDPDIPPAVDSIVAKALAKRADDRYLSVSELVQDLRDAESDITDSASFSENTIAMGQTRFEPSVERIQATIVVSNLDGYIDIVENMAAPEVDRLMTRIKSSISEIVLAHGGIINRFIGEDFSCVYGLPVPHGNVLLRAVSSTIAIHEFIRELSKSVIDQSRQPFCLLSGIETGMTIVRPGTQGNRSFQITGETVHIASRLSMHASRDDNDILVSQACQKFLSPYFKLEPRDPFKLKGKDESVNPFWVGAATDLDNGLETGVNGLSTFYGRERELNSLASCVARLRSGHGGVITISGEAGLGKSRLLDELCLRLSGSDARLLQGGCSAFGTPGQYLPFIDIFKDLLDDDIKMTAAERAESIASRVKDSYPSMEPHIPYLLRLLAIDSNLYQIPRQELLDIRQVPLSRVLSSLLASYSERCPLIVVLEDWHWADAGSRQVLKLLEASTVSHPILVIVTFRPELEVTWQKLSHHKDIELTPLDLSSVNKIAQSIFQASDLPDSLNVFLVDQSGGNPLFLEEICHSLIASSAVSVENATIILTDALENVRLPPTIQSVIRARLRGLDSQSREVVQLAAVVAEEFGLRLLESILQVKNSIPGSLQTLVARGIILLTGTTPEPTYKLKHAVIQEVAYGALLKHRRRSLHGIVGNALEQLYPILALESAGRMAHHFATAEDWPKAAYYGQFVVNRAGIDHHYDETLRKTDQLETWLKKLPQTEKIKNQCITNLLLQERLCEVLAFRDRQQNILDELFELVDPNADESSYLNILIRQGDLHSIEKRFDDAESCIGQALQLSEETSDNTESRMALRSMGFLRFNQNRYHDAAEILSKVVELDHQLGDDRAIAGDLMGLVSVLKQLGQYEKAFEYIEIFGERIDHIDAPGSDLFYFTLGDFYRGIGNLEKALEYLHKSLDCLLVRNPDGISISKAYDLHGALPLPAVISVSIANVYFEMGNVEDGLRTYRTALSWSRKSQHITELSLSLYSLGAALVAVNEHEEAIGPLLEAAVLYEKQNDSKMEGLVWSLIAASKEQLDLPAENSWSKSLRCYQNAEGQQGELKALEGIARASRKQGDSPLMILNRYHVALDAAVRLNDKTKQIEFHNTIGILEFGRECFNESLGHYQSALVLCREAGDTTHEGLMLNSVGVALHRLNRLDESADFLRDAIRHHQRMGLDKLKGHALSALGDVHFDQQEFDVAASDYQQSLTLRQELSDRRGEGWMDYKLAQTRVKTDQREDALDYRTSALLIAYECNDMRLQEACRELEI